MNNIKLAIRETLSQYPDLRSDELAKVFVNFIEERFLEILRCARITRSLRSEYLKLRAKRKNRTKIQEKLDFIASLQEAQSYIKAMSEVEEFDGRGSDATALEIPHISPNTGRIIREEYSATPDIIYHILSSRDHLFEINFLERSTYKKPSLASIEPGRYELLNRIRRVADSLSNNRVKEVKFDYDELYGDIINVEVAMNAREAMKLWIRLLKKISRRKLGGFLLNVDWLGEMDISTDEATKYIAKIMLRSGTRPKALPGFDAVKAVREVRD